MRSILRTVALAPFAFAVVAMPAVAQDDAIASLPVFKGPFPETVNMTFLGQVTPDELGAQPLPDVWTKGMLNDLWGWTSPSGDEYALATNTGGIAFVRVTDPEVPEFLGKIGSQGEFQFTNIWGDAATFGNHGYFVTEIVDSAIVIVDMSTLDLRTPAASPDTEIGLPVTLFNGGGYRSSHNIVVNQESGFAYVAGVRLAAGAANNACGTETPARFNMLILDLLANPTDPPVVACLDNIGEHDFFAVNYTGPDPDYQGSEILFVFDGRDREGQATGNPVGGQTVILDVTDKANIQEISRFRLPGLVFSHNGWTTEEQDYLFIGDEVDELVMADWISSSAFAQPVDDPTIMPRTGTYIVDVSDLDNPQFVERYEDDTVGLDHNFVVNGDKLIIASYTSGTRVLQITRDADGVVGLAPHGVTDTEPRLPNNILNIEQEERYGTAFIGQWGIYALFDSGTIIASDMNNGLIIMRLSDEPCAGFRCSF